MREFLETIQSDLGFAPPPEKLQPGQMVRFAVSDKAHDDAGWAKLFADGVGGVFGDFRRGISKTWQSGTGHIDARAVEAAEQEAKKQLAADQAAAIEEADREWNRGSAASPEHPYLQKKQVKPHNLKQNGTGALLVRLRDAASKTTGLQYINADGSKRFKKSSKLAGSFATIGQLDGSQSLLVCEGWATGASLHEATGYPVVVAFSAGNLQQVTGTFRRKYKDLDVIICADDDRRNPENVGLETAKAVAKAEKCRLAVPDFPDTAQIETTDFNDLACIAGAEAVKNCIDKAEDPNFQSKLVITKWKDLKKVKFKPLVKLLAPWLPNPGSALVHAWRGAGKTHFSLGVAYAVACGGAFLTWKADRPARVLYLDGEMSGAEIQGRIADLDKMHTNDLVETAGENLEVFTPDQQPDDDFNLASLAFQAQLEPRLRGVELVVVDSILTLCKTGKENESESWRPVGDWLSRQKRMGRTVLFVHHSGKSGAQLGTSAREIRLNTVVNLRHPADYKEEMGAVFEVHFEKHRDIYGQDVRPLAAALETDQHGLPCWTVKPLELSDMEKIRALLKEGLSQKLIAEELGKSEATICRMKNRILKQQQEEQAQAIRTPADCFIDAIS